MKWTTLADNYAVISLPERQGECDITEFLRNLKDTLSALAADKRVNLIVLNIRESSLNCLANIESLAALDEAGARMYARQGQQLVRHMRELKKTIIASCDGDCFGPGFEILLACDIILATENSRFGFPEVDFGIIPGFGGTQLASRKIYESFVKYLILTGEPVSARELETKGIINTVCTNSTELEEQTSRLAHRLAQKSSFALGLAKETINAGIETDLASALLIEQNAFAVSFSSADKREGMQAFIDKREPIFSDRWEDYEEL